MNAYTQRHVRSHPFFARNLLALAIATATFPAFAQDATELDKVVVTGQASSAYTTGSSSTATGLALSLRETPQSVTVITRARIDDQHLTSLRNVLDNTTGVYSNAWDSERVLFYSRGFLIDNLMYDGMPTASGTNFNTGAIGETDDMALYERVEVVRGATGLMTGAGSPGASINLVRKHADSTSPRLAFDLSLGSWRNRRVDADVSTRLNASGSVRGRAVMAYEDDESYQDVYRKKKTVLYGIVDADLSPATRVSFGVDYQNNKPRGNTWGSFPLFLSDGRLADWSRSVTTAPDWSFWNRRTATVFGELRHQFTNNWQLNAATGWRQYKEDMALFYVSGYPDPVTGEGLEPFAYRAKSTITERTLDIAATGPFTLFGRRHELAVGFNGSRSTNVGNEYEPGDLADVGDFRQWTGNYPEPSFASDPTLLSNIKTRQNGLYAAARISLADPVKLIVGARRARWKVDSYYLYDSPARSRYSYNQTIPYAGLVVDAGSNISWFASHTAIFKPQNARDASGHTLDPVSGRSIETGLKGEFLDKRLNTALTVFQTNQDNVAAPAFDVVTGQPILLPDGTQASRPIAGAKTRGFELEATGKLGHDWELSFGWSHQQTHDADKQAVRTFIPDTMMRMFATWSPEQVRGLTLGAGLNWQSQSTTTVGSPSGATILRQGEVTLLSMMARYQFSPNLSLQLNGSNMLDRKYYVLDEYDNTYYAAPAGYTLSLHVKF